ncbi:unnamed protein product [Meganyctiphanes norvegica]|uniref:Uncharacterized protein n=1 Tax=Meganyctiphanes norvegica TaxID=48144 RepID=A0AAV2Q7L3_MEGNR
MKWFYCSGIILLLYVLIVNGDQKGCLVKNVYEKNHWSGDEQVFYIFLLENDVVNITITYLSMEKADYFSSFYLSPSPKSSNRTETKNGKEQYLHRLKVVKKHNDWVKFILSAEEGILEVAHEPKTREQLNLTSNSIKDLIIRGSNISFCKEDVFWKEFQRRNYQC